MRLDRLTHGLAFPHAVLYPEQLQGSERLLTVCHLLGHTLLHATGPFPFLCGYECPEAETEADLLAADLLQCDRASFAFWREAVERTRE